MTRIVLHIDLPEEDVPAALHQAYADIPGAIWRQACAVRDALHKAICPTCVGEREVGHKRVPCPACKGTGWYEGKKPE